MKLRLNIVLHQILSSVDESRTVFDLYHKEAEIIVGSLLYFLRNHSCKLQVFLDDGYACHYDFALCIQEKFGLQAVLGIVTDDVGKDGYLTWAQISELASLGHIIASHGVSHAALGEYESDVVIDTPKNGHYHNAPKGRTELLSEAEVKYQVVEAGKSFATKKIYVSSFVYPFGIYNAQIVEIVRGSQLYTSAYTSDCKIEAEKVNLFMLPRIVLDNSLSSDEWVKKIVRLVET